MNRTPAVQANTFYLSNMMPQHPRINRGMWRWLEETVRAFADEFGTIQVMTGPLYFGPSEAIGNVGVPRQFFKIVVRTDANGDLQALVFIVTHGTTMPIPPGTQGVAGPRINATQADQYLAGRLTKIAAIAHLTGTDFFRDLPADQKVALEQSLATALWPANTAPRHHPEACSPPDE